MPPFVQFSQVPSSPEEDSLPHVAECCHDGKLLKTLNYSRNSTDGSALAQQETLGELGINSSSSSYYTALAGEKHSRASRSIPLGEMRLNHSTLIVA